MFNPRSVWLTLFLLLLGGHAVPTRPAKAETEDPPREGDPVSADSEVVAKLHPALSQLLDETPEPVKAWVFFKDKGIASQRAYERAIQQVDSTYNVRAKQRRQLRGTKARRGAALFDERTM